MKHDETFERNRARTSPTDAVQKLFFHFLFETGNSLFAGLKGSFLLVAMQMKKMPQQNIWELYGSM